MNWSVRVEARAGDFHLDAHIEGDAAPVAIIGPNGSGKTTLLRVVAGACRAERGRIRVGDRVLFDSRTGVFLAPEERRVGYVPQGYGLFPHLTVLDNVAFGLAAGRARGDDRQRKADRRRRPERRRRRADRRRIAAEILAEIECGHLARRYPAMLSGGEKQRVALARALLPAPEMLLLDEPLAAMDVAARRGLRDYLAAHLARRRQPAIVVTHDPRDVHALSPPKVYALERGKVVQSGSPGRLAAEPATEFVAEFFAAPTGGTSA